MGLESEVQDNYEMVPLVAVPRLKLQIEARQSSCSIGASKGSRGYSNPYFAAFDSVAMRGARLLTGPEYFSLMLGLPQVFYASTIFAQEESHIEALRTTLQASSCELLADAIMQKDDKLILLRAKGDALDMVAVKENRGYHPRPGFNLALHTTFVAQAHFLERNTSVSLGLLPRAVLEALVGSSNIPNLLRMSGEDEYRISIPKDGFIYPITVNPQSRHLCAKGVHIGNARGVHDMPKYVADIYPVSVHEDVLRMKRTLLPSTQYGEREPAKASSHSLGNTRAKTGIAKKKQIPSQTRPISKPLYDTIASVAKKNTQPSEPKIVIKSASVDEINKRKREEGFDDFGGGWMS